MTMSYGAFAYLDALGLARNLCLQDWWLYIQSLQSTGEEFRGILEDHYSEYGRDRLSYIATDSFLLADVFIATGSVVCYPDNYDDQEQTLHLRAHQRMVVNRDLVRVNRIGSYIARLIRIASLERKRNQQPTLALRGAINMGNGYVESPYWAGEGPIRAIKSESEVKGALVILTREATAIVDSALETFRLCSDHDWSNDLDSTGVPRYFVKVTTPLSPSDKSGESRYVLNPFQDLTQQDADDLKDCILGTMESGLFCLAESDISESSRKSMLMKIAHTRKIFQELLEHTYSN